MANKKRKATTKPLGNPQAAEVIKVQGFQQFSEVSKELRSKGYTALPGVLGAGNKSGISYSIDDYITSQLSCECGNGKGNPVGHLPLIHLSSGVAMQVETQNGHKGKFITWGAGNRLPNIIAMLTGMSPYVAAGHKFNTDLCAGMGPQPMYAYTQYVAGNITHKEIAYEEAGVLLQGMIRDLQRQLLKLESEHPELVDASSADPDVTLTPTLIEAGAVDQKPQSVAAEMHADLKNQIDALREDYKTWQKTLREVQAFIKDNNLEQVNLHLNVDMHLLGLCFPEIGLSQYPVDEKTGETIKDASRPWTPKVTELTYRSAMICRLEELSEQTNKIEHVYLSNQWYDHPENTPDPTSIDAIPALSAESPMPDLERIVRDARTARTGVKARPTRICFPIGYPTAGRPYYPILAWHSIFGDVYAYLMTIVGDRKRRRDNANVIGRIIYLSDAYIQRLYQQRGLIADEDKKKLFMSIIEEINNFLKNRDNMGEPLVAYTFVGDDGKVYKSWEIVEIEQNNKSTADANQTELAEISSVVFFAMGLDSQLVGNSPGTTTRSGGTDLRERYLLKQIQMSPTQQLMLKPLQVISQFNKWDSHLVWRIKREVLTTLDNSKTGITTAETD